MKRVRCQALPSHLQTLKCPQPHQFFDELTFCNVPKQTNTTYMNVAKRAKSYICIRCLHRQSPLSARLRNNDNFWRGFAQSTHLSQETSKDDYQSHSTSEADGQGRADGRMWGRLAQMTDEMIQQDGRNAKKSIEEGGFSEELKNKLEARLQESSFRSENAAAFAQATLPVRFNTFPHITGVRDLHTSSQVQAKEPKVLPPPSLGQALNASKMLLYACSTMLTSPSAVLVLRRSIRRVDRRSALICE